jgi:hypothetical protein
MKQFSQNRKKERTMNRRNFIGKTGLLVVGLRITGASAVGFWTAGCNVFTDVLNWVPVGEAAVNSILAVLTGNGVLISPALQSIIGLIEAGFAGLSGAIKEYQSTTPPPAGSLAKIETFFKDVVDNFKTFLASLKVNAGLLGIVVGLAQIVLSTIAAFMNRLPAASSLRRRLTLNDVHVADSGYYLVVVPKERTRRAFKKDFNHVLDAGSSVGVIAPKSAYLHVSLLERL